MQLSACDDSVMWCRLTPPVTIAARPAKRSERNTDWCWSPDMVETTLGEKAWSRGETSASSTWRAQLRCAQIRSRGKFLQASRTRIEVPRSKISWWALCQVPLRAQLSSAAQLRPAGPRQHTPFSRENGLVIAGPPAHPATRPPHHRMMRVACLRPQPRRAC
jgi:hypothetical protein